MPYSCALDGSAESAESDGWAIDSVSVTFEDVVNLMSIEAMTAYDHVTYYDKKIHEYARQLQTFRSAEKVVAIFYQQPYTYKNCGINFLTHKPCEPVDPVKLAAAHRYDQERMIKDSKEKFCAYIIRFSNGNAESLCASSSDKEPWLDQQDTDHCCVLLYQFDHALKPSVLSWQEITDNKKLIK